MQRAVVAFRRAFLTLAVRRHSHWLRNRAARFLQRPGTADLRSYLELLPDIARREQAMAALNARERHILSERRLKDEPLTLEELSQQYDVSRERIRQIEARAFEKLQKSIKNAAHQQRLDA